MNVARIDIILSHRSRVLAYLMAVTATAWCGQPLPGQIIVDPAHPQWLKHNGDNPFFMCGPGDPEGFLYRGAQNPDGTRDGDQMALIEKMIGAGANCIYLMAVRSHGGDGDATHNPFIGNDPARGINTKILGQWETWFQKMDECGIVIYFFIYDDNASLWDTGDEVGEDEKRFLEILAGRFEHHKNLIWCIAEEYQERFSAARVKNIAAVIRAADDRDHAIAVHLHHGLDFSAFADDPNIDQFAIQYNVPAAAETARRSLGSLARREWTLQPQYVRSRRARRGPGVAREKLGLRHGRRVCHGPGNGYRKHPYQRLGRLRPPRPLFRVNPFQRDGASR